MSQHAGSQPMTHRPYRSRPVPVPVSTRTRHSDRSSEEFRQLRHLTKNALQRIIAVISSAPELEGSDVKRQLRNSLEERVLITATLSDALFDLTRQPQVLRDRLMELSSGLIRLFTDDVAMIKVTVNIGCEAPVELDDLVVRVAHELIGNALKHGMHQRILGKIAIRLREEPGRFVLTVSDDGWGLLPPRHVKGEGLLIVDSLLRQHMGTCDLRRDGELTVATVAIPRQAGFVSAHPDRRF